MALINCPECQKEISDKAATCPNCGILIKGNKVKAKIPMKYIFIGSAALCVVAIVAVVIISLLNNPAAKFKNALLKENWEIAISIYNENKDNNDFVTKSTLELENIIDTSVNEYISEEISFDESVKKIEPINPIFPIQETKSLLEKIKNSKSAFESAESSKQNEDYYTAIINYEKVISEDTPNYEKAQEAKADSISALRQSFITEADKLSSDGDLIGAYQKLKNLSDEYRDDSYNEKINDLEKNIIDDVVKNGNSLLNASDYVGAYKLLFNFPSNLKNAEIIDIINKASDGYKNEILNQAELEVKQGNYDNAIAILKEANSKISISAFSDAISNYNKEKDIAYLKSVKNQVVVTYDNVEQRYHIYPVGFSTTSLNINENINVEAVLQIKNKTTVFGLLFGFMQPDWIFMEKITIACGEKRMEIDVPYSERVTHVGYEKIAEAYLMNYSSKTEEAILLLTSNDETTIRFTGGSGKGKRDHKVTTKEKNGIKVLWNVYSIIKNDASLIEYIK